LDGQQTIWFQEMNMPNETQSGPSRIEDVYPLSSLQQGMLFHSLLAQGTGVYIEQVLCELHEVLDEVALRQAWAIVIDRHPVLRTDFRWADLDEPQQVVHAQVEVPWEQQDWRGTADAEQERRLTNLLEADRRRGFDMACGPLLRFTLLRCCENKSRLIWTFHHALVDGRSFAPVLREVFAHYEALRAGTELRLGLPRPYRDYISWLQTQDFSRAEGFWTRALEDFTTPTPLLADHVPSTDRKSETGGQSDREIWLSTETTSALRSFAAENGLTLNTIVQGAWSLLLSRYSDEAEVVFGVTRACRRSAIEGAEAMIGLFINTLPMRVRVSPEVALIPWLKELRAQSVAIREHEHTPLEKVRGWSKVPAGRPLFETIVVFENFHLNSLLRMQGGPWSNRRFRFFRKTNYPVVLAVYAGTELCLNIGFDRSRLGDATVGRMLCHLRTLLKAMVTRPRQRQLRDLPLLTPAERHQLLVEWNQTEANYPRDLCVHELFEAQVEHTPDAIAVEIDERHLTYRELNSRSNQLANYLRKLGVGPEVLVGLCMDRWLEMIVGLFGIFKAGGVYVPIDPGYPVERIAFILNDANAPVVLTQRNLIQTLPPLKATKVVCLDNPEWTTPVGNAVNLKRTATNANLAYVIYTSGSTGQPKGVMIPHQAIVNVMLWIQSAFPLDEGDCVLHQISISFDPSLLEILAPLFVGGRLVLARPGGHQDPASLVQTIVQRRVTILHLVPSMLAVLLETPEFSACHNLRHVFCGGELLTRDVTRRFFEVLNAELHCVYGPTEVGITSVYYSIPRDHSNEIIPIGRPVANTQAHVLDRHRQLVPIGVRGELYLGGVQVGRGYYNQPELTRERFIADPFNKASGARLYKTGDLVCRLPDGNIQFLGRMDHQVKIRGYRIELGEIESVMRRHLAVKESVVVVQEVAPGDKRLVAYVRPASSSPALVSELRSILKERLPTYMVPSAFVFLDAFPVTPNGKLDRKALPPPDARSLDSEELEYTPTQEMLAGIWCELLKLNQVGVHENFFELGGHSLMIVRLINRINQAFSVRLGVPQVFHNPTVEKLARVIVAQQSMSKQQPNVVQFQQGKAERSVYFIFAGPSECRFAEFLDGRHPTFGIQVPWPLAWRDAVANKQTSAFPSMEQLVAPYVAALSSHIRSSSCVLAGHSFAGLMAFEAAHQFQSQGGDVDMVILFDTWVKRPTAREVAWHKWRQEWNRAPKGLATDQLSQSIGSRLRNSWLVTRWMLEQEARMVFRALLPSEHTCMPDEQGAPLPWRLVERLFTKIFDSYHPRRLDSRGVLFRSEPPDKDYTRAFDDSLGWKNLFAGGLEIIPTLGDHLSMFRQHNQALAQQMNEVLKRYWMHPDDNVNDVSANHGECVSLDSVDP
jgi:amino acid adenylation domain-containing protein